MRHSTFVKWTGWTLTMALLWWQHHKHCLGYYYYYYYQYAVRCRFWSVFAWQWSTLYISNLHIVRPEGLLYDAERDLWAIAKFLVPFSVSIVVYMSNNNNNNNNNRDNFYGAVTRIPIQGRRTIHYCHCSLEYSQMNKWVFRAALNVDSVMELYNMG